MSNQLIASLEGDEEMTQPPHGYPSQGHPQPGHPQYPGQPYPQSPQPQSPGQHHYPQYPPAPMPPGQPYPPPPAQQYNPQQPPPPQSPGQPYYPAQPGQPYPQQPYPGQALVRPPQIGTAMTMSYILAALGIGAGLYVLVLGLAGGGTVFVVVLFALVFLLLGVLNLIGALSLAHRTFPNVAQAQMGAGAIATLAVVNASRSVRKGFAEPVPLIIAFCLVAVAGTVLYMVSRPGIKEWIVATHRKSLAEGHVPRNQRRR